VVPGVTLCAFKEASMPKTLLLADDSITIQRVVAITFANEDFTITTVDNGEDAILKAKEMKPDVILADVIMPKRNGYEVCKAVKSDPELSRIPVLLLAGTFEAFDENRATEVGANGHITKPFESQALIDRVKELVLGTGAPAARPQPQAAPPPPVRPVITPRPFQPGMTPQPPGASPAITPRPLNVQPQAASPAFGTPTGQPLAGPQLTPRPISPMGPGASPAAVKPVSPWAPSTPTLKQPTPAAPSAAVRPIEPKPIQPKPIEPKPIQIKPFQPKPLGSSEPSFGKSLPSFDFADVTEPATMKAFGQPMDITSEEKDSGEVLQPEPFEEELTEDTPTQPPPTLPSSFGAEKATSSTLAELAQEGQSMSTPDEGMDLPSVDIEEEEPEETLEHGPELAPLHEFVPAPKDTGRPTMSPMDLRPTPKPPAEEPKAHPVALPPMKPAPVQAFSPAVLAASIPREELLAMAREIIEKTAWEVVPQLAETILREEIEKLVQEKLAD
jgi:CheY-like chemotaxis protein